MSFDKFLQDVIQQEVARAIAPLQSLVEQLAAQGAVVARLTSALGGPALPVARKPGRPPAAKAAKKVKPAASASSAAAESGEASRGCALEGCNRPARSKGYCAAHYQKYRMLQKTGRLPEDWTEFAPEGSVKNVTLPRGRAGAKALAKAK